MVFLIFILKILSLFHYFANGATCFDNTENSACSTAGCFWNAGICKAAQCSLPNCAAGCDYEASLPAICVDDVAEACAAIGTDEALCAGNDSCELTSGSCGVSAEAEAKCDVSDISWGGDCPQGCDYTNITVCEPLSQPPACDIRDPVVKLTRCTFDSSCKWETTEGGKCVSKYGGTGSDSCNKYDNTEMSECLRSDYCTVSGGSCVYDPNSNSSLFHSMCKHLNVTEETTECELDPYCQIVEGECVNAEGRTWEGCRNLSTDPFPICSLKATELCTIENGECVPGFAEYCGGYSEYCVEREFCKLNSNNKCVFDADFCEKLSLDPYTECTHPQNYGGCKVVTNDGAKQCQLKTPSEYCSTLSSVKYSLCEQFSECQIVNGQCVGKEGRRGGSCKNLGVEKIDSECTGTYVFSCETSQTTGGCVPHIAHCNMNAAGTSCDVNNAPLDKCFPRSIYTCVNVNCSNFYDDAICTEVTNFRGGSAGCEWSAVGICVAKTPLSCTVVGTDACSSDDCTLVPGKSETCNPNAAITDAMCGILGDTACGQSVGCAWSNTGGTCVEKSCGNSPSYALCCNGDASCAYCTAKTRPSDCPEIESCDSSPTYALCCNGDASCAYCTTGVRPSDCPEIESCDNSPSYALCCNGDASCAYCTGEARPSDCPDIGSSDCAVDPRAAGCESSAFRVFDPTLLVLAVLFIGWI